MYNVSATSIIQTLLAMMPTEVLIFSPTISRYVAINVGLNITTTTDSIHASILGKPEEINTPSAFSQ